MNPNWVAFVSQYALDTYFDPGREHAYSSVHPVKSRIKAVSGHKRCRFEPPNTCHLPNRHLFNVIFTLRQMKHMKKCITNATSGNLADWLKDVPCACITFEIDPIRMRNNDARQCYLTKPAVNRAGQPVARGNAPPSNLHDSMRRSAVDYVTLETGTNWQVLAPLDEEIIGLRIWCQRCCIMLEQYDNRRSEIYGSPSKNKKLCNFSMLMVRLP